MLRLTAFSLPIDHIEVRLSMMADGWVSIRRHFNKQHALRKRYVFGISDLCRQSSLILAGLCLEYLQGRRVNVKYCRNLGKDRNKNTKHNKV